jgi:prepilin-type processing-associated H-X9-DG protein/prepilin-type N-terminal cleavage/methylation domain-containing protein
MRKRPVHSVFRSAPRDTPGRGDAFTLIELLVVISIIALLIAILLPALSSAKDSGRSVQCLSNLRQMNIAAQAYITENNESYPPAYWYDFASATKGCWDITTIDGQPVPGSLWQSQDTMEIQQCPSFDGDDNSGGDPYTGYNYNTSFIGGYRDFGAPDWVPSARGVDIQQPTVCAVFGDGEWASGANKFMRAPIATARDSSSPAQRAAGTQGYRHLGSTNVAFADGHAENLGDPHAPAAVPDIAPGTGFLSDDNSMYDLE